MSAHDPRCDARFVAIVDALRAVDYANVGEDMVHALAAAFASTPRTIRREIKRAREARDAEWIRGAA